MKISIPIDIQSANIIETNVPHDDAPEYASATEYSAGDVVMIAAEKSLYEHVGASPTTGVSPLNDTNPPTWLRLGATNRWRAFDKIVGSNTSGAYTFSIPDYSVTGNLDHDVGLSYKIRPNTSSDMLAMFNVSGLFIDVIVRTTEGVVYEHREMLGGALSESTWYSYFYEPLTRKDRMVLTDLPITQEKDIYVSVAETGDAEASIGEIAIGRLEPIGKARHGTGLDFIDFSTKERDQFGNFQIVERGFADDLEVDLLIPNSSLNYVRQLISKNRAKPVVWIASECYEVTTVYGYLKSFSVIISGPEYSESALRVEGLI